MNPTLADIPDRILGLATGALTQANTHAVFADPGNEHWGFMCVINTAHAGELFLKAVIAREHPLLIFKDLFILDDSKAEMLDLNQLIQRGRTHDFDKLPQIMWAATGRRIPNLECFERLRRARNAVQHFCVPEEVDLRRLSLEFIYTILDPLIVSEFGLYAIDYHEDHSVGYDYVVGCLLRHQLRFSVPEDFDLTEIRADEELEGASDDYRNWFAEEMRRVGRAELIPPAD